MRAKFNRVIERFSILTSTTESLRKRWPKAPKLSERHIRNCKLITDRLNMLNEIPKGGVIAELGIYKCEFSTEIFSVLTPSKFHLIDIDSESIQIAKEIFSEQINRGKVVVHHNDSAETLQSMKKDYFDWIYIDADHTYAGVKKDLEAAHQKLKPDGLISLNDYIYFGSSDLTKYGVIEAVNEFCINYDYEVIYLALHGRMYNDVTLRRLS